MVSQEYLARMLLPQGGTHLGAITIGIPRVMPLGLLKPLLIQELVNIGLLRKLLLQVLGQLVKTGIIITSELGLKEMVTM